MGYKVAIVDDSTADACYVQEVLERRAAEQIGKREARVCESVRKRKSIRGGWFYGEREGIKQKTKEK